MISELAGRGVPRVGLGCMGMSEFYGPQAESASLARLHEAFALGYRHFDTADMYGMGQNELLLGRFVSELGARRSDILLASKVGIVRDPEAKYSLSVSGRPEYVREACERSLRRLNTDHLDLYYLHRQDPAVPLAETVGALARLVEQGKVRALGLSEVSADVLRQAHAVHPIAALQSELSLWSRDVESEILPTCAELSVAFIAFSPLGRGFLTGAFGKERIRALDPATDLRAILPRFQAEHLDTNLVLLGRLRALCAELGQTPARVALAWVLAQGRRVHAIPGSTSSDHLRENFAAGQLSLSASTITALEQLFAPGAVSGARYPVRSSAK